MSKLPAQTSADILPVGTRLGRYEIHSLLGAGGMGQVYLAEDVQLERTVALKVLPAHFAGNEKSMERFVREAKAASTLSHPNIVTIHEIGVTNEINFIATEFVDGQTLRREMEERRLDIDESLDIASQIASALIAAHAAGVVHRDIKPENIMLRRDKLLKVLDFGLCKLLDPESSDKTSKALAETDPNILLGTPVYMSPEQARGLRVDGRTDIWSLGVVLYEMIAGRPPFEGSTPAEMIASILEREPPPLARYNRDAPDALEWIVNKALRKDREERYQSAREFFADLRSLRHHLDFQAEMKRSGSLEWEMEGSRGSGRHEAHTLEVRRESSPHFRRTSTPEKVSSAEYISREIREHKRGATLALLIFFIFLLVAGFGIYKFFIRNRAAHMPFQNMKVTKLTATGKATRAVISPSGKFVVHVMADAGKQSLWVRQVATTSNVEIVAPDEVVYRGMTFSADGNYVYYVVQEKNNPIQSLYQVPVLGGTPKKVLTNIDTPITISPDGNQFAFGRRIREQSEDALIIVNADGTGERKLASRKSPDFFGVTSAGGPSWSPDGKTIACPAGSNTGGRYMNVVAINVADGKETPVSDHRWFDVGRIAWASEGAGLVVDATEQGSTSAQLWYLTYPGGDVRKITNDLNDYRDISLTADSAALVTVQNEAHVNVWVMPNANVAQARQLTTGIGTYDGARGISFMPDGRIVYVSRVSGSQDLWIMDADGGKQLQLTTPETRAEVYPATTPDGRYIIFTSNRTGNSNIWRINPDGTNPVQLTKGNGEEFPNCSPDGKWVVYTETGSSKFTLWKVAVDGGQPVQLTEQLSQWPVVSPDGKLIACWYRTEQNAPWKIAILPFEGGAPLKMFDVPPTVAPSIPVRWTADGHALTYIDVSAGVSNIWSISVDGGSPRQLTDFKSDQLFWFDWSRDGRQLVVARGSVTTDVVLISDFK